MHSRWQTTLHSSRATQGPLVELDHPASRTHPQQTASACPSGLMVQGDFEESSVTSTAKDLKMLNWRQRKSDG